MKHYILILFVVCTVYGKTQINIGAIFASDDEVAEIAFRHAVLRENMYNAFELKPIIKRIDPFDSFEAERTACDIINEGVAAIFGPNSMQTSGIVGSISNELGIPHLTAHWMPPETIQNSHNRQYTRNFFPSSNLFSRALGEVIVDYDWKAFTIVYENRESLVRLHDVLQIHSPEDHPVTVRQLPDEDDYRPLLKEVALSGETRILLDCSPEKTQEIIKQAIKVKMMEEYQSYIITAIDAHTLDFAEMKLVRSNITTIRMMSSTSVEVLNAVHDWQQDKFRQNSQYLIIAERIKTEAALLHDAVRVFSSALQELNSEDQTIEPISLKCNVNSERWGQGLEILQVIDKKTQEGMTGPISFDDDGLRNDFYLEILELSKDDGFKKIATWDPKNKVNITRAFSDVYTQISQSIQNKTFTIVSRIGMPFLRQKIPEEGEYFEGNDRYEGFAVDLVDGISKMLGFKYVLKLVEDNNYGSYNKETKKWNGLVKELLDRKADLAICDLTITYERRAAVDFTSPFMTLGISILYAKPNKEPPGLFSFMAPLSLDVWIYMATAFLCISVILFILAKMAADDWENPHPCVEDPEELETIWNMHNCIWLTVGSIMQQGCDILPKAVSTRLAAGIWWFFALIVISSYTANLAAFLTMERMDASIESAEDLAKQSKIKYGVLRGGSTRSFFEYSNFSTYQRMWAVMESAEPSVFTEDNLEGEERVAKGNRMYAFLMESSSIEYITERNCNLTRVGGLLDSKGYGIAMPVNSPYRTFISGAVLKMQEEGKVQRLKNRWWKEKNHENRVGNCDESVHGESDAPELGMDNVGGVFLVLAAGLAVSVLIGILEFLWNVRKVSIDSRITPYEAFKKECKFAMNIRITKKPIGTSDDVDSRKSIASFDSKIKKSNPNLNLKSGSLTFMNNI